jgi:hypothetical protein
LKAGAASALKWIWNAAPDESDNWTRMSGALARRGRIIVVSGTEAMEEELHRDPELENRFETVSTSYLDLRKTGDAESFRDVAIDIGRRCGLPDSSMGGRDGRLFVALYLATAADLRKVEKLLNRADKLRKRNPQMPMHQLLDLAFQQTQSSATVAQGLFSMPTKELSARYDAFRRAPRTPSKGKQVRKS